MLEERHPGSEEPVCKPRLKRICQRRDEGKPIFGRALFAAGRELHRYWAEHGIWPVHRTKCRLDQEKVMLLAVWMYQLCSQGWRPGDMRPRIVGNEIVKFPYFLR